MVIATIRAPEKFFHLLHASDAVADAGFRVLSDFDAPGLPKGTGWVSFRVECPKVIGDGRRDLWMHLGRLAGCC